MRTSESINEIAAAMSLAQGLLKPAIKDSTNPHYKSKYADLASVWSACRPVLSAQKIVVWQELSDSDNGVAVTTRLVHASGQWVEFGPFTVPVSKPDAHGVGSAASYAKRYHLAAAVGIASEDDDGSAAVASVQAEDQSPAIALADRFTTASNLGIDEAIWDLHEEANLDEGLYRRAWALLPSGQRASIKKALERVKAAKNGATA